MRKLIPAVTKNMGGCASKQTDADKEPEHYMTSTTHDESPFSALFELHKAICKVGEGAGSGLGFLCKFPLKKEPRKFVHGVLTTNYTLSVNNLRANQVTLTFVTNVGGQKRSFQTNIDPLQRFCFTCPILDATFIHITGPEVAQLTSHKRLFLELSTDWEGTRNEEVLVVKQQVGNKSRFANGKFMRYHGINFLHTSSTEVGSWGSPIALRDGKVVGLHKRKAPQNTGSFEVALSTKTLVEALWPHCETVNLAASLVTNPIRFNSESESRIVENGLTKCAALDNKSLIFVSPTDDDQDDMELDDEGYLRQKTKTDEEKAADEKRYISPIWFVPTSHGWYWTPTDPFDRSMETNWMSISERYVRGGPHHKKKMLEKDIDTTLWLQSTGGIQKTEKELTLM